MYYLALLIAILCNVAANIAFKKLMSSPMPEPALEKISALAFNQWAWIGGLSALVLLLAYLYALKYVHVGIAYATVTGSALLLMTLISAIWLNQPVSFLQGVGMLFVTFGLLLMLWVPTFEL